MLDGDTTSMLGDGGQEEEEEREADIITGLSQVGGAEVAEVRRPTSFSWLVLLKARNIL